MNLTLFAGALATGFLGSGHCLGMCGTLVAALSLSRSRAGLPFHLLYNAGRCATYALLGWLAGWLGLAVLRGEQALGTGRVLLLAADGFVFLAGLGTALGWGRLNVMKLEFPGPARALAAGVGRLNALPPLVAALPLGAALGFLPCGFLYAVLLNAALAGSPAGGAWTLVGFGLGTAPALLAFGGAAHWLGTRARGWLVRGAGLAVAATGAANLVRHWTGSCCL